MSSFRRPLLLLPVLLLACGGSVAARGGTGDGGKAGRVDDATTQEKDAAQGTCPSPTEIAAQQTCTPLGANCPGEPEFNTDCDPLPTACVCKASGWSCAATASCPPCGYDFPCGRPHQDAGVDAGVDACVPKVPDEHRATAASCSSTRPPGYTTTAGVDSGIIGGDCTNDSQCADGGVNGRCTVTGAFLFCTFDACTTDSDCGPNALCICGAPLPDSEGRDPNECVAAACHVDSDCGPGGYCSPSPNPCSFPSHSATNYANAFGYYCHAATELCTAGECVNDSDCQDAGGYCEWNTMTMTWGCDFRGCT